MNRKIDLNDGQAWRELNWDDPVPLVLRSDDAVEKSRRARLLWENPEFRVKSSAARKGKTRSVETLAKMSAAAKNRSSETRARSSAAKKGKKWPPEAIVKRTEARRRNREARLAQGIQHPNKGRTRSPESIAKSSAAQKGRIFSPETKEKLRQAWARRKAAKLAALSTNGESA